ncbi:Bardet-Biedl syndrome 5 protein homolog isoform X2 [Ischnura elegans]|uniref:Bardet-Biedl syndrome 5 protein homolog isoform X2 n=1 Tax=Ischnura elegans TaxID=197161 RepID=UPI001ED89E74|nr:Bardet-Biedl syndrome 5 protein homolog isoform X2 [Ischnura elegans]
MADSLWEDRDVRFDIPSRHLTMRLGEKTLDVINSVEDTKGNMGDNGRLVVTNLRLIWHSLTSAKISISIGWNCILQMIQKSYNTRQHGESDVVQLLAKTTDMKFEFIFTNLMPKTLKDLSSVVSVHKSYVSSRMYRELKLRGALLNGRQLKVLPLEKVISNVNGVWNLSNNQGTLGTFIITNVRLVWVSDTKDQFNISIPYLQIIRLKARESKFGRALVIECSESSGGYVLGFRIDPRERLEQVLEELTSLFVSYSRRPNYGVEYVKEDGKQKEMSKDDYLKTDFGGEDLESVEEIQKFSNAYSAYLADGHAIGKSREPIYSKELGLAIEKPPDGFTLKSLWEIIPSK